MKDLCQYGNRPEDEWEILPWIPDPRPPFKIWVKPEQIAPFFLIPHHPYAISLLLKISDGFRTEEFCRLGLTGSSGDWERLVRGVIREFEESNSGEDLFHFDSDEDMLRKRREELLEEIPDAPDGAPVPDDAAVSADNIEHLTELIGQMKPMYRDPLRLLAMGYTNREIAESLGLTDEVVRMRLFRGRKLLWKELNSHE